MRRSVLMQTARFVSSGNRKGASFELETNFLSDRLGVEQSQLLGGAEGPNDKAMEFPHSGDELTGLRGRLPRTFDWRKKGAVTSVRCWYFSLMSLTYLLPYLIFISNILFTYRSRYMRIMLGVLSSWSSRRGTICEHWSSRASQ